MTCHGPLELLLGEVRTDDTSSLALFTWDLRICAVLSEFAALELSSIQNAPAHNEGPPQEIVRSMNCEQNSESAQLQQYGLIEPRDRH